MKITNVKHIHSGQYQAYGDHFDVFEFEFNLGEESTDILTQAVIDYDWKIGKFFAKKPTHTQTDKDFGLNFAQYLSSIVWMVENKYKVTFCRPYCD